MSVFIMGRVRGWGSGRSAGRPSVGEEASADLGLLRQQDRVDVRQHAARGDGDAAEELVELLVVADGEDQVARSDALLLVVAARVARQLEHLSRHVLDDRRQVDGAARAVALGQAHGAQAAANARHREGEARLGRLGDRLLLGCAATALDHGCCVS